MRLGTRVHRAHIVFLLLCVLLVIQFPIRAMVEDIASIDRVVVEASCADATAPVASVEPSFVTPPARIHPFVALSPLFYPAGRSSVLRI